MQAVILAAGRGERMRSVTTTKPLLPLLGLPLLERSIRLTLSCGITEIIVVTGHRHDAIEAWHQAYMKLDSTAQITLVYNENWEATENGTSLLAAAPRITGPFLLLMADHVYTPELISSLCAAQTPDSGAVLATDGYLQRPDIDLDDVTRVQSEGDRITQIGKGLHPYNGFDTGAFLCSPAVLELMQHEHDRGRTRISDVMQLLADNGTLRAHRIDGMYWQDVDTPAAHASAEQGLLHWAAGKPSDGAVARWVNRPFSRCITQLLAQTPLTPNHVSLIAFGIGLIAALCLALGSYWGLLLGGVLAQVASVVDGCDGELARLRFSPSNYGGWFDALLDRYADAAILAGMTWHAMSLHQSPAWMWLGILAISGSFISSYSAHKADTLLPPSYWRIGRDTRSLIIMMGAILALPVLTLSVIALSMNAVVIHRIIAFRRVSRQQPVIARQL